MTQLPPRSAEGGFLTGGLRFRLALMMLLALLPLGLLSLGQTNAVLQQADEGQRLAALGETMRAAEGEIILIRAAQTATEILALALAPLRDNLAACQYLMDRTSEANPDWTLLAYVSRSGQMDCATKGNGTNFKANARFKFLIDQREPHILISQNPAISTGSILVMTHPVFDEADQVAGYVSLSLPHDALPVVPQNKAIFPGADRLMALVTFDHEGTVLTASSGLPRMDGHLPRNATLLELAKGESQVFIDESLAGERLIYSTIPLTGGLYVLGVWQSQPTGLLHDLGLHPYAFPLLMWLAGLAVAILGADRLVIRHLRRLAAAMRRFTFGERSAPRLTLDDPPREIATLAETYGTLTATILRDEAELENLIRQKEELLREVHHRTGNSLQLIASILRMHRRETDDPQVLTLIDTLHDRVMSLSTVHLGLYRIAGREDVAMNTLVADVIAKVGAIHWRTGRREALQSELRPVTLTAQQAVPLALLLAEMLACVPAPALEQAGAKIRIELDQSEGKMAWLSITMPAIARPILVGDGDGAPAIIAYRLIRSFVQQLDGDMRIDDLTTGEGAHIVATVSFAIRHAQPQSPAPAAA